MTDNNKYKIPNTEIKLMLDRNKIMEEGFNLSTEFKNKFNIDKNYANMKIWYLDTCKHDLHQSNWTVRFRFHEDYDDLELSYKKRYSEHEYNLQEAKKIKKIYNKFEPEIDMGYKDKTYSFSCAKKFTLDDMLYNLQLDDARKLAIKKCPLILENWTEYNWGYNHIYNSILYGPITAVEYKGMFDGIDIKIEIWKLDGYFPELSFDYKTNKAQEKHDKVIEQLQEDKLLSQDDLLKTDLFFDYYSKNKN